MSSSLLYRIASVLLVLFAWGTRSAFAARKGWRAPTAWSRS